MLFRLNYQKRVCRLNLVDAKIKYLLLNYQLLVNRQHSAVT